MSKNDIIFTYRKRFQERGEIIRNVAAKYLKFLNLRVFIICHIF